MPADLPVPARVAEVRVESPSVRTIVLDSALSASPGQFVMAWLPGLDEKPFSLVRDDPVTLAVANVGKFSAAVHALRPGDRLWVRGPYGRGFRLRGGRALLVAGGYGVAPLAFLARRANSAGVHLTAALGARTVADVVLAGELARLGCAVHTSTEDGSSGFHGLVTDLAARLTVSEAPDTLYACGPEGMLHRLIELSEETCVACQVSLERRIKCGFGVCGSCDVEGRLVCVDGPVFSAEELRRRPWNADCSCDA